MHQIVTFRPTASNCTAPMEQMRIMCLARAIQRPPRIKVFSLFSVTEIPSGSDILNHRSFSPTSKLLQVHWSSSQWLCICLFTASFSEQQVAALFIIHCTFYNADLMGSGGLKQEEAGSFEASRSSS